MVKFVKAVDAFFSEEPYKSYREYFTIKYVDVVSENEIYNGETALETWYTEGDSRVGGNDDVVIDYALEAISEEQLFDALIVVIMNRDYYAGTCYMYPTEDGDYGRGLSISYFPTYSNDATFCALMLHEAGGHGFGKLGDEYNYTGTISDLEIARYKAEDVYGWWRNVDFTNDPLKVKWAYFLSDSRYANEGSIP